MYGALRAVSVIVNSALFWSRFWAPRQTLCAHAALARKDNVRVACLFCRVVDSFHRGHCDWSLKP